MALSRHFLPWDRPLLPQAVEYLAGGWRGPGPLDLADLLVVVPTRQSGRRLREALAAHAEARQAAVFPPRVMLPESLLAAGAGAAGIATRLESHLAWIAEFRELELEEFRAVFPLDPPARNFAWAQRLAQTFGRLQATLAEAGLRLADVTAQAGPNFPEAERWTQLARLEARHAERLAARGRREAQAAKLERARAPAPLAGIRRIVVLGMPDPLPLARTLLEAHAAVLPVEIVVYAPAAEAAAFDAWGRPREEAWETRGLDWPDFERHVQVCADPAAQAERVAGLAAGYGQPEGLLGVGVADAEVLPLLDLALGHAGLETFNPEGRARRGDGLHALLAALAGLAREDDFARAESLARCPDFLDFLQTRVGTEFSPAGFLAGLDELHARHLPPSLAEARRHEPGNPGLRAIAEVREGLTTGRFPANAAATLGLIFGGRRFRLTQPADAQAAEAAEAWMEILRELAAAAPAGELTNDEWWELALGLYGETVHYDEKAPGAVELQGWLELLWEDAPHLVVAGLNDGRVPDAVVGDPFLPEALRVCLGLKTNGARFARDAYLLQALAQGRARSGSLDLLVGKTSAAGDPLRPSRLLLQCADAALPARVEFLFRPAAAARANPPWRRAWPLVPPRRAAPDRLAVTALRDWLACPFRFYLKRVLRLEAVDPAKNELSAMDFGTLCHAALEAMGREPALRDCVAPEPIRDFLLAALDRTAAATLGPELTLPLRVQLASARQRLGRAAEVQAQLRAEGWVIQEVERPFSLEAGGLTITGKIDRIDRHATTGAIRVLDYKTSDQPDRPQEVHLRRPRAGVVPPEFACLPGAPEAWRDLQLPLYLRALAPEFPGERTGGYFNLPKASTATGLALWDDATPELAASAWACATGVAAAIQAGRFWPPSESVNEEYDDFAPLFHQGAAASVAWGEGPP